jgi:hypothetical protein
MRYRIQEDGLRIGRVARRPTLVRVQLMSHPSVNLSGFPRIEEAI